MKKTNENLVILITLFAISIVIANVTGARTITTGLHIGPIELGGQREAAPYDLAVHLHGASATDAMLAARMSPGEAEIETKEIGEVAPRFDTRGDGFAIHPQGDVNKRRKMSVHVVLLNLQRH